MQTKNTIKKSALAPTILIAGGAGFIGSHLTEVLLQREARVIVLDNFGTGKETYVNHLIQNPKFALFDVDINQGLPPEIESVDYIFHLAGLEEYLFSKDEVDLDSLLTNAVGTKNLLDLARSSDAKFLLSSTIDVYEGMMSQLSIESYFGKNQFEEKKYSLSEAKRYAEALIWEYYKKYGVDVRIVRLPEVYGPRMGLSSSGSLGNILKELIQGRDFTIKGDGGNKEFYLYIDDAISGMIKALLGDNTIGKIYTLVPKESISVLETAFLVRSVADRQVDIKTEGQDLAPYLSHFVPDTFTLSDLDWVSKVELKDGIITTLSWFGYKVNEHSFKTAKILEQKQIVDLPDNFKVTDAVTSLQFVKSEAAQKTLETQQNYNSRQILDTAEIPKVSAIQTKEILPKVQKPPKIPKPAVKLKLPNFSILNLGVATKLVMFFVVLFSFLTVFIFLPLFQTYTSSKKALAQIEKVPSLMGQFDANAASQKADEAYKEFSKANKYFSSLSWVYKLIGQKDQFYSMSKFLSSVTYFSQVTSELSLSISPFKSIWESMKPNSQVTFDVATLDSSKLHISNAKKSLQLALADFSQVDVSKLPKVVRAGAGTYQTLIKTASDGLGLAWAVTSDLPELLGFDSTKKYLILFQNNNELRPTGGFIGSYAFLYLNKGRIEDLNIDDIYNPDGQIDTRNIKIMPPKPIGDFLAEDRLYIRNANWDPDFIRTSETIKDLFYRLNGESIDGVVAVDLDVVKKLLDITGPIFLTAYNEEVSSQNLYERTQFNTSFNYKDGSQQKRDYLTVMGSKLLETLLSLSKDKTPDFLRAMETALHERHLQVYLFSSPLNATLLEKEWAGNLIRTTGDFLEVVNANLGGTKANYYVKNEMNYKVTSKTRDGLLRGELTLSYNHTGIDESWPGGPYTNYVRVIVQKGSKLTGAKIIHDETIEEDIFKDMVISEIDPYTSFETSFILKPSSKVKVVLYYDLPQDLSMTKDNKKYSLVWQKEAGTQDDDFTYSFALPFGMEYLQGSQSLKLSDTMLFTSGKLNQDFKANIELK